MKNRLFLFAAVIVCVGLSACEKLHDTSDVPKEQLIPGKWRINRIQLRIYYNGAFAYDTILKFDNNKQPNYVDFQAANGFEYKYNATTANKGTYSWLGEDSLICVTPAATYRWKKLTLTDVLCTVKSVESNPLFPGAVVERYQTFTKPY